MTPAVTAKQHFARIWPTRHDDTVVVFANGHSYGIADRRETVRMLIRMMRRDERWGS